MTAAVQTLPLPDPENLRPFNFHRDLGEVADLIELCFAGRLDGDGRRYVAQMRRAAQNPKLLSWTLSPRKVGNLTMGGFVWQEGNKVVGNLSCLPIYAAGKRAYLIANVAVHPDHQRRGIARKLTEAALDDFRIKGVEWSWLQVDDDNLPAASLYDNAGFSEVTRRTTWHSTPSTIEAQPPSDPDIKITRRKGSDWALQEKWLDQIYPPSITWHLPLRKSQLKSGLQGYVNRLMEDKRIRQWSLRRDGELLAVGTLQNSPSQADKVWLACDREHETTAISHLVPFLRKKHNRTRTLSLDYPTGQAQEALHAAGFIKHQTLIWMRRRI